MNAPMMTSALPPPVRSERGQIHALLIITSPRPRHPVLLRLR